MGFVLCASVVLSEILAAVMPVVTESDHKDTEAQRYYSTKSAAKDN